jgi:hypothetical protein
MPPKAKNLSRAELQEALTEARRIQQELNAQLDELHTRNEQLTVERDYWYGRAVRAEETLESVVRV